MPALQSRARSRRKRSREKRGNCTPQQARQLETSVQWVIGENGWRGRHASSPEPHPAAQARISKNRQASSRRHNYKQRLHHVQSQSPNHSHENRRPHRSNHQRALPDHDHDQRERKEVLQGAKQKCRLPGTRPSGRWKVGQKEEWMFPQGPGQMWCNTHSGLVAENCSFRW